MKLYFYEHCPYSARARMALNLKAVPYEAIVLPADDERTLPALIGRHQIPVLVKDDGEPMTESMAIARHAEAVGSGATIAPADCEALSHWLEPVLPVMQYLGYPRWTRIGLGEFATPAAYEHFRAKKTHTIGEFGDAVANTGARASEITAKLTRLSSLTDLDDTRETVTMADVFVAPMLRSLSVVEAIAWPADVRRYTEGMCRRSQLDTFFDRAQ